jgi:hypothetical protein
MGLPHPLRHPMDVAAPHLHRRPLHPGIPLVAHPQRAHLSRFTGRAHEHEGN